MSEIISGFSLKKNLLFLSNQTYCTVTGYIYEDTDMRLIDSIKWNI